MDIYLRIAEAMIEEMKTEGLPQASASAVTGRVMDGLREAVGGQSVYFSSRSVKDRNRRIRITFNGRNLDAVCRQFGVSKATVYRVSGKRKCTEGIL